MKKIFLSLLLITSAEAKTFEDLNIKDGYYTWLRLNTPGSMEATRCLKAEELPELKEDKVIQGSLQIKGDRLISTKNVQGCHLIEEVSLKSTDGNIAVLKAENVETSGCSGIEFVRTINAERPYDDENLNLTFNPFKIVEINTDGELITFKRRNKQCFYARKIK